MGVDPALVLCYRDEYVEILADKRGDFDVLTVHEWLLPSLKWLWSALCKWRDVVFIFSLYRESS